MPASSDSLRPGVRRNRTLQTRRTLAKAGMGAAMGILVWSALAGRQVLRRYHAPAGIALIGFTVWHLTLYQRKAPKRR